MNEPSQAEDTKVPWWFWAIVLAIVGFFVFTMGYFVYAVWDWLFGGEPRPDVEYTQQLCEHLRYRGWGPDDSRVSRWEYNANC